MFGLDDAVVGVPFPLALGFVGDTLALGTFLSWPRGFSWEGISSVLFIRR